MSTSLVMRALFAATALAIAPAIAGAQAPQTKSCKDGTSSSRSTFACWGHGGVDTTTHLAERPHAAEPKHHGSEAVQAGTPRTRPVKSTAHKDSKAKAHHAKVEHKEQHETRVAKKKQDETHRGWLPWRHKKEQDERAKKKKKKESSSHAPLTERPNGKPRQN
ncbi:MAG: hypothetical protein ACJ796_02510 [Gemmatimonadaceae bacterium]